MTIKGRKMVNKLYTRPHPMNASHKYVKFKRASASLSEMSNTEAIIVKDSKKEV